MDSNGWGFSRMHNALHILLAWWHWVSTPAHDTLIRSINRSAHHQNTVHYWHGHWPLVNEFTWLFPLATCQQSEFLVMSFLLPVSNRRSVCRYSAPTIQTEANCLMQFCVRPIYTALGDHTKQAHVQSKCLLGQDKHRNPQTKLAKQTVQCALAMVQPQFAIVGTHCTFCGELQQSLFNNLFNLAVTIGNLLPVWLSVMCVCQTCVHLLTSTDICSV